MRSWPASLSAVGGKVTLPTASARGWIVRGEAAAAGEARAPMSLSGAIETGASRKSAPALPVAHKVPLIDWTMPRAPGADRSETGHDWRRAFVDGSLLRRA